MKLPENLIATLAAVGLAALITTAATEAPATEHCYRGACDGSAAVAVDETYFLAASDEDSVLRLYRRDEPGLPLKSYDLGPRLELGRKARETDIEGAARLGDVAYWITSHARAADGRIQPDRERFFATRLSGTGRDLQVDLVGRPYKTLIADLSTAPQYAQYDLLEATARQAKEKGGLNIEGLCADGRGGVLIGFRNPIPHKRALIAPLQNPAEVVQGARPVFGDPIELSLGKLGVRDLAWHDGRILIAAGPRTGADRFALFSWAGPGSPAQALGIEFTDGFTPEGALLYPETGWRGVHLLSDDSGRVVHGCECRDLTEAAARQFRARWVELPKP